MKVAIIGAGAAGLASARHVIKNGHTCDVFEMAPQLGGTWVYTDDVGQDKYGFPVYSPVYKNLKTNLPKEVMGFPDFQISHPESYLMQEEVLKFLLAYADKFHLFPLIKLNHIITKVRPVGEDQWAVTAVEKTTKTEFVDVYDSVMVCNGHFNEPSIPIILGKEKFNGTILHSRDYRDPKSLAGLDVLLVGAGHSGMYLTLQISNYAKKVVLSHHVKDAKSTQYPPNVEQKPDIKCIMGKNKVEFVDETCGLFDVIIFCTGYTYKFPFLDESCGITVNNNHIRPLYKHIVHIERPTMSFIGMPYCVCAFPLFDLQARFYCKYLNGDLSLPSKKSMHEDTEKDIQTRLKKGYSPKQMHLIGSNQEEYYNDLAAIANIETIAPVYIKLRDESHRRLYEDLVNFRQDRYKIVNDEVFERVN